MSLVNTARRLDTRSSQRMAKLSSQSPYHDIQVTFVGEAGNVRDAGETLRAGMQLEAWLQLPRDWRRCQRRLTLDNTFFFLNYGFICHVNQLQLLL